MRPIRWLRRGLVLAGVGAAGGALIVTARHMLETPQPLQSALPGEARIDRKHGGDIYYNVAGAESAEPLVLLHDFYPGASNFEYRHLFPRLAPTWRVYAPDWLGFGMSEHPSLAYTGEFYANTLIGFLRDVVGKPAVLVGHGRAANIAARAAADAPDLIARLVLVSPDAEAGIHLEPKPTQLLARAAQRVSLGLVPYAFLSTKPLLRRVARNRSAQTGEAIASDESLDHLYASAHQFGGQHALMALLIGELDLPLQNVFPLLQPPVLVISGDEDAAHPLGMMEDLAVLNSHADLDVLSGAGEAVFEDQPARFTESLLAWLQTPSARQQPQVEETHPRLRDDALTEPSTEPLPDDAADTSEVVVVTDAEDADDTAESAGLTGAVAAAETISAAETSESIPEPFAAPTSPETAGGAILADEPRAARKSGGRGTSGISGTSSARKASGASSTSARSSGAAKSPKASKPSKSAKSAGPSSAPKTPRKPRQSEG